MKKGKWLNIRRAELSLLCALGIAVLLSTVGFAASCEEIRGEVLRMHVIANSDSESDQAVKLKVRDAVLETGKKLFDGSVTAKDAQTVLGAHTQELEEAARRVLAENGMPYGVHIEIGPAFFETRTYDGSVTLPAGTYEAVNVILGAGEGKNWWCVMFPPLCLPAAEAKMPIGEVLDKKQLSVVESDIKFEPRFKIVEIYEKIWNNLK